MRISKADSSVPKGWYFGPWNSDMAISVGYANTGVDELHLHRRITEIYLMARGTTVMSVDGRQVQLGPGDVIAVDPGEAHTFLSSSPDHCHFVVHTPGLEGDEARQDKVVLPTETG